MIATYEDVLNFWLEEIGQDSWYKQDDTLDQTIRDRFMSTWEAARDRKLCDWCQSASGALALLIVLDQFPRNMFRDDPRAFATDSFALTVARRSVTRGFDQEIDGPARQFFYMPMMHSESLSMQEGSVRQFMMKMPGDPENNLLHARVHREIIRLFGRFPYRNGPLGRKSSPAEQAFLDGAGYAGLLNQMKAA